MPPIPTLCLLLLRTLKHDKQANLYFFLIIRELPTAIVSTGNSIKDIRAIIMGHLHLDHAGGLENFCGTDIPIHVHESEFKHAFHSVATKSDIGVYLPHYLNFNLNWQTWY